MTDSIVRRYKLETVEQLESIDDTAVVAAVEALRTAYENERTVFVIGNGGSAANANHFAADFGKNAVPHGHRKVRILSLCTSAPAITALGNDVGFDSIYREQLSTFMREGDVLLAYSVSGNSPDIIEAAQWARDHGGVVIGLCGFDGGALKGVSDVCIHTSSRTYEIVEDMHSVCGHMFTTCFKSMYESG